ncbi:putative hemoglobin and hemoglobin-haptoglobin-binding protein 1 precursor, partial [Haemophilus influenzae]
MQAQLML